MHRYHLAPLGRREAEEICDWTYGPGYGLYDMTAQDLPVLLSPDMGYYAVWDGKSLAGFACFGLDAQIYGGPYERAGLDLGCGMAPSLCGQGLGLDFFSAIVAFACRRFRPPMLRLTVAADNHRAITVYERASFIRRARFAGMTRGGVHSFLLMTRKP